MPTSKIPKFANKPRDVTASADGSIPKIDYRAIIPGEADSVSEGPMILRIKNTDRYVLAESSNVRTVTLGELRTDNALAQEAGFSSGQAWADKIASLYKNKKKKDGSLAFPEGVSDDVNIVVSNQTPGRDVGPYDFIDVRDVVYDGKMPVHIQEDTNKVRSSLPPFIPVRDVKGRSR